jgi:demethylmenaquinone methyltransferase/2-methoxy-6-polyprenyl-1,4-benzoquinol methylase
MSTLLLMKLFERTPGQYDKGIRMLTGGHLDALYDGLVSRLKEGDRVLDIGCGTGALSLRAAKQGAKVKAIDINPGMLEAAREKAKHAHLAQNIEFVEMGVAELGGETDRTYDAVMSGLCLSELTEKELDFAVKEANRILKPGGFFLVVDEARPRGLLKRCFQGVIRAVLKIFVYLLSGTTTKALKDFPAKIKDSGFEILLCELSKNQSLIELSAIKKRDLV